jgi:hypothetical protein
MSGINAFFRDVLGASFANARWSWGGVDHERRRVFLRVWQDDIADESDGRRSIQVLRKAQTKSRPGWNGRVRHIELIREGYRAFGVMCERAQRDNSTIVRFDADEVLELATVTDLPGSVRLDIVGTLAADALSPAANRASALAADPQEIAGAALPSTTRTALIEARLGEGRYRRQLLETWKGMCAVTGCTLQAALRASHSKPWRARDDAERLDPDNGLLLVATLDALFDAGLIAFADDGTMLVSHAVSAAEREMLGLPAALRRAPTRKQARYLQHHRERLFMP